MARSHSLKYVRQGADGAHYTEAIPRRGPEGTAFAVVKRLSGKPTIQLRVEHRDAADTCWQALTASSFGSAGEVAMAFSEPKELVRCAVVPGSGAGCATADPFITFRTDEE